ncbi:MAG: hypothetical protein WAZ27_04055 [Minisyncoccia bacterium]
MVKGASSNEQKSKDPRQDNQYMAFVDDLRGVVSRWITRDALSEKQAAEKAGLHPKTVVNFLTGHTMAPQLPTLFKLLRAAGAAFTVTEDGEVPRLLGTKKKRVRR